MEKPITMKVLSNFMKDFYRTKGCSATNKAQVDAKTDAIEEMSVQ